MLWRVTAAVLAAGLAAALVPAITHLREPPPAPEPVVRTSFTTRDGIELGAGESVLDAAVSRDGTLIAFVATRDRQAQLFLRGTAEPGARPLAGTDGAMMPAWKPRNGVIAFFAEGALKQVTLNDAAVHRLAPADAPAGAAWLTDGSLLFAPDANGPIKRLRTSHLTDATRLRSGDRGHLFPSAGDAGGFVYIALRTDGTRIIRLAGRGEDADLTHTSGHAELIGDVLVWVRDGTLLAQRLDIDLKTLVGRSATALVPDVGVASGGHGFFAASQRLLLTTGASPSARELAWFDARGQRIGPLIEPGEYSQVRLSPNDREAALTALDPLLRTVDVFAVSLDNPGRVVRVSLSLGADGDPAWSPDSSRVAYRSAQRGGSQVLIRDMAATAAPEVPLANTRANETITDWRGRQLLLHTPSGSSGLDIWMLDTAKGTRTQVTHGAFNESGGVWSPDGSRIAYVSDESGQPEVYVVRWPGGNPRVRASFGGGLRPQWGRDGRTLFFMRGTRIMRTLAGADLAFSTPETALEAAGLVDYAVAHLSDRFAVLTRASSARPAIADAITGWLSLVPAAPR